MRVLDKSIWGDFSELGLGSEKLEDLQLQKLKHLLIRVYDHSAYYREKFDKAGVNPHQLSSLQEFQQYPTFDKYEERESQAQSQEQEGHPLGMHLTCDIRDVNRMSASSGTTGTPSFQGHTKHDREVTFKNFARLMDLIGGKKGDKVMMAGVMSMWVAGIPTVDALLDYGANVIPIGGLVGTVKVAEMMQLTRPEIIICTPSFARVLVKKSKEELGVDIAQVGIKKICVYGEPGGSIPEIVQELSEGFGGAQVFDMGGGTGCLNPIFSSCPENNGMHFIAPETAYIELYDRETKTVLPWNDGAEGEFVYTGLDRECGPLVRFMDGDLIRINTKPCACGLPGTRISIIGRVDDMLLVKGVNVFPTAVRDLILGFKESVSGNVRVIKDDDSPVVEPPLRVKVECLGSPSDAEKALIKSKIEADIQRQLRFRTDILLFNEGELEMEYGATGKIKLTEIAAQ